MHQPLAPAHGHREAVLADLLELAGAQTYRQVRCRAFIPSAWTPNLCIDIFFFVCKQASVRHAIRQATLTSTQGPKCQPAGVFRPCKHLVTCAHGGFFTAQL